MSVSIVVEGNGAGFTRLSSLGGDRIEILLLQRRRTLSSPDCPAATRRRPPHESGVSRRRTPGSGAETAILGQCWGRAEVATGPKMGS